jgi:hypothetical protein
MWAPQIQQPANPPLRVRCEPVALSSVARRSWAAIKAAISVPRPI